MTTPPIEEGVINPAVEAVVKRYNARCRTATCMGDYDRFRADYLDELGAISGTTLANHARV